MKLDISAKYLLKSLIPILIILTVFYLGWKDNQENARMFYAFIGCIISAITFPFSMRIIQKMVIRFTGKEFWQKDFFTNPVGGSLTAIFELFCFVISVPVVAIYLIFILCKALSGK
ncbi:TPA: colicin transporter [Salmonella enterica]|nr:colicin transporter [Salmonella enterica]